jgi:hypothetical protein
MKNKIEILFGGDKHRNGKNLPVGWNGESQF